MGVATTSQPTILLIEDEPSLRRLFRRILADDQHRLLDVDAAESALELIAAGLRPCLMLTDRLLPGMSGDQLLAEVRGLLGEHAPPALLMSGAAEGLPDGAAGLLKKPFRNEELRALVRLHCVCSTERPFVTPLSAGSPPPSEWPTGY